MNRPQPQQRTKSFHIFVSFKRRRQSSSSSERRSRSKTTKVDDDALEVGVSPSSSRIRRKRSDQDKINKRIAAASASKGPSSSASSTTTTIKKSSHSHLSAGGKAKKKNPTYSQENNTHHIHDFHEEEDMDREEGIMDSIEAVLPTDAQISIMSFLDLDSLRQLMSCNRRMRSLLLSEVASSLWLEHCKSKWIVGNNKINTESTVLQDNVFLPTATTATTTATANAASSCFDRFNNVNVPLLLCKTSDILPAGIEDSFFEPGSLAFQNNNSITTTSDPRDNPNAVLHCIQEQEEGEEQEEQSRSGIFKIRYTGVVGTNHPVYSVRSVHPFPRPTLRGNGNDDAAACSKNNKNKKVFGFRKIWTLKSKKQKEQNKVPQEWNPFVAPFRTIHDKTTINVTPRLVSYFEISVLQAQEEEQDDPRRPRFSLEATGIHQRDLDAMADCIVIGLATEAFDCQSALPGWNKTSFGYHSDDGGIYHGSGRARKRAGGYGPGDTVGMGVDYVTGKIFVTRNGKLVSFFFGWHTKSWKGEDLEGTPLYPVVGIDSKDTVEVNYNGMEKPFQFDLAAYCVRQQQIATMPISKRYQFSASTTTTTTTTMMNV
eukprot:scaffold11272_cov81-Cylindrotheca_fusiformis.AAC.4